jgi:hypothetical protein
MTSKENHKKKHNEGLENSSSSVSLNDGVQKVLDAEFCDEPAAQVATPQPTLEEQQTIWFEQFWQLFWRKVDKHSARKAFRKHARTPEAADIIISAVKLHSPGYHLRDPEYRPYASTWLNHRRYEEPFDESLPRIHARPVSRAESAQLGAEQTFLARHAGSTL